MSKYDESSIAINTSNGILEFIIKCNEDGYYHRVLYTLPYCTRTIEEDGVLYADDRFITLISDPLVCKELSENTLNKVIRDAIIFITSRGKLVDISNSDKFINDFINKNETCEYVKDIDIFPYDGQINLDDEVMQRLCIEKPVRNACKYLTSNGVNTLMSSANRYNVESKDEPVNENKLYIGHDDKWVIGNGYAWIMLDWNDLSSTNKQYFMNAVKHDDFVKLYEYIDVPREVALEYDYEHSKIIEGLNIKYQTGEEDYDANKVILFGNNSLNNYDLNVEHCRFKTVVLRYPVDEKTTAKEADEFFMNFGKKIVKNNQEKNIRLTLKNDEQNNNI